MADPRVLLCINFLRSRWSALEFLIMLKLWLLIVHLFSHVLRIKVLNLTLFWGHLLTLVLAIFDGTAIFFTALATHTLHVLCSYENCWLLILFSLSVWAFDESALRLVWLRPHSRAFNPLETLGLVNSRPLLFQLGIGIQHFLGLLRSVKPFLNRFVYLVIFAAIELKSDRVRILSADKSVFPYLAED